MQQMKFGAFDDICNTSLVLGLHNFRDRNMNQQNCDDHMPKKMKKYDDGGDGDSDGDGCDRLYTCLSLGPPRNQDQGRLQVSSPSIAKINQDNQEVSSFFSSIIKKEKEDRFGGDDQNHVEVERVIVVSSRSDEDIEDGSSPRKKLRLTKEQAVVLEDCFKEHTSLNPKQKQALSEQLNLKPRQVEVWFQNRRARNKLKKNEVDCELLKKCCEALKEENRRLQKEVEELKSLKLANTSSFCMQLPVTTFLKCPSCERAESNGGNDNNNSSSSTIGFTLGVGPPSNKPLLYLPNFNGFSASNSTSISN